MNSKTAKENGSGGPCSQSASSIAQRSRLRRTLLFAGQFEGTTVPELLEGNISEGFSIGFHRYDVDRKKRLRDFILKVAPGNYRLTAGNVRFIRNAGAAPSD